jgi:hypothetical protein
VLCWVPFGDGCRCEDKWTIEKRKKKNEKLSLRLPGVEPGSIAWKAIILTVGLQTLTGSSGDHPNIWTD